MSLKDEITNVDTDVIRIRKQRDALNNQNARLTTRLEELEKTLAIVDRVVQRHRGQLEIKNREGGGLAVRIWLKST